ncbi:PE-PGRS family protein [Nitrospirillum viridazoti Y2]|nr:PE-PGRS family protein [Nitrospirillum amazonense Y2]
MTDGGPSGGGSSPKNRDARDEPPHAPRRASVPPFLPPARPACSGARRPAAGGRLGVRLFGAACGGRLPDAAAVQDGNGGPLGDRGQGRGLGSFRLSAGADGAKTAGADLSDAAQRHHLRRCLPAGADHGLRPERPRRGHGAQARRGGGGHRRQRHRPSKVHQRQPHRARPADGPRRRCRRGQAHAGRHALGDHGGGWRPGAGHRPRHGGGDLDRADADCVHQPGRLLHLPLAGGLLRERRRAGRICRRARHPLPQLQRRARG